MRMRSVLAPVAAAMTLVGCSFVGGNSSESTIDDVPGAVKEMAGKSGASEFGQVLVRGSMINMIAREGSGWRAGGAQAGSDYTKRQELKDAPAYTPASLDAFPLQDLADKMSATSCEDGQQKMGQIDSTGKGAFIVSVGCDGPNVMKFTKSYVAGTELPEVKSWVEESAITKVLAETRAILGDQVGELKFRAAKTTLAESSMNVDILGAVGKQPDGRTCAPTMIRYATPDQANEGEVPMARYQACESGQQVKPFGLKDAQPASVVKAMEATAKQVGANPDEVEYYSLRRSISSGKLELRAFHRGKQAAVLLG